MNKFVIPAVLASIIVIAGIFAFMPIEKVTTVHSTIVQTSDITSNVRGIDRYVHWEINFTNMPKQKITLIPASSGTITGFAVLTAEPNHQRSGSAEKVFRCGLSTTTAGEMLGINATQGNSTSLPLSAALGANEGIVLEAVNSTNTVPGVCSVTLIIDSSTG
ncbi:MAG: hypothetical protein HYS75_03665 [Nitrosopumilales archaeon]|nr:hypothetical protein [Nitrosopumilales archaeon]